MPYKSDNFSLSGKYKECYGSSDVDSFEAKMSAGGFRDAHMVHDSTAGRPRSMNYGPATVSLERRAISMSSLPSLRETFGPNSSHFLLPPKSEVTGMAPEQADASFIPVSGQESLSLPKFSALSSQLNSSYLGLLEKVDASGSNGPCQMISSFSSPHLLLPSTNSNENFYNETQSNMASKMTEKDQLKSFYGRSQSFVDKPIDSASSRLADQNSMTDSARSSSQVFPIHQKAIIDQSNALYRAKKFISTTTKCNSNFADSSLFLNKTAVCSKIESFADHSQRTQDSLSGIQKRRSKSVFASGAENLTSGRSAEDIKRNIIQHLLSLENIPNEQLKKTILSVNSKSILDNYKLKKKGKTIPPKISKNSAKISIKEHRKLSDSSKRPSTIHNRFASSPPKYSLRERKKLYRFAENESLEEDSDDLVSSSSSSSTTSSEELDISEEESCHTGLSKARKHSHEFMPLSDQESSFHVSSHNDPGSVDSSSVNLRSRSSTWAGMLLAPHVLKSTPALAIGRKLFFLSLVAKKAKELYFAKY